MSRFLWVSFVDWWTYLTPCCAECACVNNVILCHFSGFQRGQPCACDCERRVKEKNTDICSNHMQRHFHFGLVSPVTVWYVKHSWKIQRGQLGMSKFFLVSQRGKENFSWILNIWDPMKKWWNPKPKHKMHFSNWMTKNGVESRFVSFVRSRHVVILNSDLLLKNWTKMTQRHKKQLARNPCVQLVSILLLQHRSSTGGWLLALHVEHVVRVSSVADFGWFWCLNLKQHGYHVSSVWYFIIYPVTLCTVHAFSNAQQRKFDSFKRWRSNVWKQIHNFIPCCFGFRSESCSTYLHVLSKGSRWKAATGDGCFIPTVGICATFQSWTTLSWLLKPFPGRTYCKHADLFSTGTVHSVDHRKFRVEARWIGSWVWMIPPSVHKFSHDSNFAS